MCCVFQVGPRKPAAPVHRGHVEARSPALPLWVSGPGPLPWLRDRDGGEGRSASQQDGQAANRVLREAPKGSVVGRRAAVLGTRQVRKQRGLFHRRVRALSAKCSCEPQRSSVVNKHGPKLAGTGQSRLLLAATVQPE